jgi:glycosyltransferase involved in cell wall biosynthesis
LHGADLDPRRRNLYGTDLVFVGDVTERLPPKSCAYSIDVSPLWGGIDRLRGTPIADATLVTRVLGALKAQPEGRMIIGSHHLAEAFGAACARFIFDPTDSAGLYYWRRVRPLLLRAPQKSANSLRLALHYQALERNILRKAQCFITSGVADERYLKGLCPEANVLRVENGTDFVHRPPVKFRGDGRTIGFHGGMTWEPNRETAERLAGPIAAALARQDGPSLRILIGGRPLPPSLLARHGRNGVEICGFIADLTAWLGSLSLYVMPMRLGGGVKNKLIEAMAAGVPVLTNARGAESLPPEARAAVAIAESDDGIARTIRSLLNNSAELSRMRQAARSYAERNFDWARHRDVLHAVLKRLPPVNSERSRTWQRTE